MSHETDPVSVVESLIRTMAAGRFLEAIALYDDAAIVDICFAPPRPVRLEGREALERAFGSIDKTMYERIEVRDLVLHQTADPEVVIAEWEYHGTNPRTGQPFQNGNIIVVRVRNGKIVSSRDYHDHLAAAAVGQLPALVASFGQGAA